MPNKLTGSQLFLRYAFVCAEDKLRLGKISRGNFEQLKLAAENNLKINNSLLEYCFGDATQALRVFSEKRNVEIWSFENVAKYWRHNHGHDGDCAVRSTVVTAISPDNLSLQVILENKNFWVKNYYNLNVQMGDSIYLHKRIAIEIDDE